jgi:hypothetical protein
MEAVILELDEMLKLVDEVHNPPAVRDQKEQNHFQAEIRALYEKLVDSLSGFGLEGDYYGVSDFAIRPDLRDRPTTKAPPAPHRRQFTITIITKKFYRSDYLQALCDFLSSDARGYRIEVSQDFDAKWHLTFFLTHNLARVFCTSEAEKCRLLQALGAL